MHYEQQTNSEQKQDIKTRAGNRTQTDNNTNTEHTNSAKEQAKPDNKTKTDTKNSDAKQKISKLALFNFVLILVLFAGLGSLGFLFYNFNVNYTQNAEGKFEQIENYSAKVDKNADSIKFMQSNLDIQRKSLENILSDKDKLENAVNEVLKANREQQRIHSIDWQFAEIEYLLRVANQELILSQDTKLAIRLLKLAQNKLNKINLGSVLPVSKALHEDIKRLQNSTHMAVADISMQLLAISETIEQLQRFEINDRANKHSLENSNKKTDPTTEMSWSNKLWKELKSLIVIKTQAEQIQPILSIEDFHIQKQRLLLLLNQASWASLHKNTDLYAKTLSASVEILRTKLNENINTQPILESLQKLQKQKLSMDEQHYSNALAELEDFLEQRYADTKNSEADSKPRETR